MDIDYQSLITRIGDCFTETIWVDLLTTDNALTWT